MGLVTSDFDFPWDIYENNQFITGYTDMDNFDMERFLEEIDVNINDVEWGDRYFDLDSLETDDDVDEDEIDWRKMLYEG